MAKPVDVGEVWAGRRYMHRPEDAVPKKSREADSANARSAATHGELVGEGNKR